MYRGYIVTAVGAVGRGGRQQQRRRGPGRPPGPPPNSTRRRAELLDAAERAIRRVGADVSMSEIAAEAGLTKPALYAAFPNKASLADALAERIALDLGRQIAQLVREDRPVREVTHTMVERFCALADGDPQLYRFLVHGSMGL